MQDDILKQLEAKRELARLGGDKSASMRSTRKAS